MATTRRNSPTDVESPSLRTTLLASSPLSTPGFLPPVAPFARDSRPASIHSYFSDSPYGGGGSRVSSLVEKYDLPVDPRTWNTELSPDFKEDDDELHAPLKGAEIERDGNYLSKRGAANLGCTIMLVLGMLTLFAGYPIITRFTNPEQSKLGAFNLGGTNGSGQVAVMDGRFALIDPDTPEDAYTKNSWNGQGEMELVFSDEFNLDGRTFYPGDDPYWEAVDLHYWPTNNLEWYDPEAVRTSGGSLVITLSEKKNHDLDFQGGMLSTWNKFCFTGGYIESRVILPGINNVEGLWPAIWTMGNLGRAGYGATTDGLWPYSYDSCDVGTVANQSINGEPAVVLTGNDIGKGGFLSFLPGQRLSKCTCHDDKTHPGPKHSNGDWVGRSAPEIDIFEAQSGHVTPGYGEVSQSAQWAPYNAHYIWNNETNKVIADPSISIMNGFTGNVLQQATSIITRVDQACYELTGQCYSIYGFEYKPGFDDGYVRALTKYLPEIYNVAACFQYITWISDNKVAWTLLGPGMAGDVDAQISNRPVAQEPMYIIANLGMSANFGNVDLAHLTFPVHMFIDYIRVYQAKGQMNIGCDPKDYPTASYIDRYIDAYTNPNFTTFTENPQGNGYNHSFPGNSWLNQC